MLGVEYRIDLPDGLCIGCLRLQRAVGFLFRQS